MNDEPTPPITLSVQTVPVLDTGLGIEAGYESDAAMIAAAEAERAAMDPQLRELIEQVDAEVTRRALFGA